MTERRTLIRRRPVAGQVAEPFMGQIVEVPDEGDRRAALTASLRRLGEDYDRRMARKPKR